MNQKTKSSLPDGSDTRLTVTRQIRFADQEWKAATKYATEELGGAPAGNVIRKALRTFLNKNGYL